MKKEMTLEELAEKSREKCTHIRSALEKIMEKMSEIKTGDDSVWAKIATIDDPGGEGYDTPLYLVPGRIDLAVAFGNHFLDYSETENSWNALKISEIKKILKNFPAAIQSVKDQLKKNIDFEITIEIK